MTLQDLERIFSRLEDDYRETETMRARLEKLREYVDQRSYRADVVAELPESAPFGLMMITPADPWGMFVGAGPGRPLRKVTLGPVV